MTTTQTPSEQFRAFLVETLATKDKTAMKIDAIMIEFDEWINAHQAGAAVEVVGGRVVVQRVEAYGLTIGLDACGRAVRIETIDTELTWAD